MTGLQQLIAALKSILTWWVCVAPWEQAIRVRLGKRVELLTAGFHLRIPIADRVFQQSIRRRSSALPPQTLVTKDGRPLTVAAMVGYRIADLRLLYETLHHAEGTIQAEVLGAMGQFVTSRPTLECTPGAIHAAVPGLARLERYGLADVDILITSFAYVRTYRLITGEGHSWNYGDNLDTHNETRPAA